ncbi:MAG: SH3 domain-containing protein [Candidatus Gracilibacteria bacterium]|nr:SH3 domain-containing protein [Candidatus Gracilibacteria bacterium]
MQKQKRFIALWVTIPVLCSLFLVGASASDQWYVVSYYLNVRSEGRYGTPIITAITRGDKVTVLASLKNGWKKIELSNGTIGYVNGRYLSAKEPIIHVSRGDIYQVSVGNAFMRGDTLQTKVAVVKKNDTLEIMDDGLYQGKWLRAKIVSSSTKKYDNRIGYISKELVEAIRPVASIDPMDQASEGDWIEDFNVINAISVSGSGSGVGTLAPITSSAQADIPLSGTSSSAAIAPIAGSGTIASSSGATTTDESNALINDIFK